MDHSYYMDHEDMSHGGMGHGDMGGGSMCKMNMLFNWDVENVCIVFSGWRVTGWGTFLLSLLGVMALTACYEGVRELSRRYESSSSEYLNSLPKLVLRSAKADDDENPRSWPWLGKQSGRAEQKTRIIKAALYGLQVFYSFFIMLLFMTYNGFIMISVGLGASLGYLLFGSGSATKTVACH